VSDRRGASAGPGDREAAPGLPSHARQPGPPAVAMHDLVERPPLVPGAGPLTLRRTATSRSSRSLGATAAEACCTARS
jgi:hypothetical protein